MTYQDDARDLWVRFLSTIDGKVSAHVYSTFFTPMQACRLEDDLLVLDVGDTFLQEWITANYRDVIEAELTAITGQPMSIELEVNAELREEDTSFTSASVPAAAVDPQIESAAAARPRQARSYSDNVVTSLPDMISRTRCLNRNYIFDTFVRGPSNDLALAASIGVSDYPAERYNPLFLFGGVGLGKTHLLHAVGHRILERNPAARVVYTSSEEFVNEVVNAMQQRNPRDFYLKYREHCDVLLMDDIQLIAGKERTQHEFFHIFNILHNSHRQIVVTSDKLPHEIPDMEERLRNRFQWGLIADIHQPELETRVAILRRKADLEGHAIPNEVAFYIAEQIPSNVRKLEGALIRLLAHASLTSRPLTVDYTREVLGDVLGPRKRNASVEDIQQMVADYYQLRVTELRSNRRDKAVIRPRQVAMYLARKHLKASYPQLAERFGGRDHTTVMSACRKIDSLLPIDTSLKGDLSALERQLLG